jgi:hypothetical protein
LLPVAGTLALLLLSARALNPEPKPQQSWVIHMPAPPKARGSSCCASLRPGMYNSTDSNLISASEPTMAPKTYSENLTTLNGHLSVVVEAEAPPEGQEED